MRLPPKSQSFCVQLTVTKLCNQAVHTSGQSQHQRKAHAGCNWQTNVLQERDSSTYRPRKMSGTCHDNTPFCWRTTNRTGYWRFSELLFTQTRTASTCGKRKERTGRCQQKATNKTAPNPGERSPSPQTDLDAGNIHRGINRVCH